MPGRICGSGDKRCTACCKTHPVKSIKKAAYVWCTHCIRGKGCGLYPHHPEDCEAFVCQWLQDYGTDDERPDKIGIVVDLGEIEDLGGLVGQILEVSHGAFSRQQRFVDKALQDLFHLRVPVVMHGVAGLKRIYFPPGFEVTQEIYDSCVEQRVEMKNYNPIRAA